MKIDCVYTMANAPVRLQFLAMERSLRAVGCDLPLRVIPYDERKFDLPPNAEWWTTPLQAWMREQGGPLILAKNQCITLANYFFTDVDIVYLRNPVEILAPLSGFVVADTEWNKPMWCYNEDSARILYQRSSTWQKNVFSSGFFACDRALYTPEGFRAAIESSPEMHRAFIQAVHDQPGINLLVALSNVPVTNLTLAPHDMESTWAGDYPGAYEHLWRDPRMKPAFIHWAGPVLQEEHPINALFYEYLTADERREWDRQQAEEKQRRDREGHWPFGLRVMGALIRTRYPKYRIQYHPR